MSANLIKLILIGVPAILISLGCAYFVFWILIQNKNPEKSKQLRENLINKGWLWKLYIFAGVFNLATTAIETYVLGMPINFLYILFGFMFIILGIKRKRQKINNL